MNKAIITIIIIAVVAGGYLFIKKTSKSTAPVPVSETSNSEPAISESTPRSSKTKVSIAEEKVITYADTGYSPSSLRVKVGDVVVFKNASSRSMWPASATHPAHKDYPTTGGCLGSTFDACKGVQPDESWSFKFDIAGNWKYHDHLNPKNFGAIIVE